MTAGFRSHVSTRVIWSRRVWATLRRAQHLREFLRGLQGAPGPKFPILLKKVIYNGTHTGDWHSCQRIACPFAQVLSLLREREILHSMKRYAKLALQPVIRLCFDCGSALPGPDL